jgi:hypothetical protein
VNTEGRGLDLIGRQLQGHEGREQGVQVRSNLLVKRDRSGGRMYSPSRDNTALTQSVRPLRSEGSDGGLEAEGGSG